MNDRKSVALLLVGIAMISQTNAAPLAEFSWKSRILVIIARTGSDEQAMRQRQIYERASKGMSERDVVLVEAIGDSERSRQIRSRLSTGGESFKVFLLGKDGNTALSSDKPLTADDLFQRIDAMPMRQDEMRRMGR